jgi:hypothetical protein
MGLIICYNLEWQGTEPSAQSVMQTWRAQIAETPNCRITDLNSLGFKVKFAEGAETAKFELKPDGEKFTGFSGCKTQFAALQVNGGIPNFLKGHKLLVQFLDLGQALGIVTEVTDDGCYWETRNEAKLIKQVQLGAQCIAWLAGTLGDTFTHDQVISPIKSEPNFETLEAQWQPPTSR